jgi:hypothetical protein
MRRGPVIVLIFILVVAAVIGASQFMRAQPPLEITVAVSPLAGTWVGSAANNFNATNALVNGTRRVQVKVTTIDDLAVWSDAGQSQWLTTHPTAWIPASSASIGVFKEHAFRMAFKLTPRRCFLRADDARCWAEAQAAAMAQEPEARLAGSALASLG